MIQCIDCPCGKTFAAASEPFCYEDADWQREMRNYIKKGCKVKLVEDFSFENCTCKDMKPEQVDESQISLF